MSNSRMSSSSSPAPSRTASTTDCAATPASTTRLTSWNTAGNGDTVGAGRVSTIGRASRSSSTAQVPFGSPARSMTAGCSSPAWPMTTPVRLSPTRTSAHRPGCHGGYWAARRLTSTPPARATMRTASKASAASTARPAPHGPRGSRSPVSTVATCCGWRGSDASSAAISSSVGRRCTGMSSTARVWSVGWTTCAIANSATSTMPRDMLRTNASNSPGSRVVASCGRSASNGLSTCEVVRRGSSGGRPQVSNTPAGRNGVGSTST